MRPLFQALQSLEGLSVGDAFGQCFFRPENPQSHITEPRLPEPTWYYTDDTEMALSVVSVLARFERIDQAWLAQSFAERYDYDRAYGPSMHRVLARIRDGEPWQSVVNTAFEGQGSYGNGAAMRAAPLGAFFWQDLRVAVDQAVLSAEVTHAHPEGIAGASAVALAAAVATQLRMARSSCTPEDFLQRVISKLPPSEVRSKLIRAQNLPSSASLQFAVAVLGNGTGMSAQDTVPVALWCSARHLANYSEALWLAVSAGGDRDTLCAIVGGVVGSFVGVEGIPETWRASREILPAWHLDS